MWRASFGAAIRFADDMARGFDRVAAGALQDAIARPMAALGKRQLLDTFRISSEPSGKPWRPLVARTGAPLVLTGEMRASSDCAIGPKDDGGGFDLTYVVRDLKAIWHQKGTQRGGLRRKSGRGAIREARQHIPPRKMLFETARDAAKWIAELVLLARDAGEAWMRQNFRRV